LSTPLAGNATASEAFEPLALSYLAINMRLNNAAGADRGMLTGSLPLAAKIPRGARAVLQIGDYVMALRVSGRDGRARLLVSPPNPAGRASFKASFAGSHLARQVLNGAPLKNSRRTALQLPLTLLLGNTVYRSTVPAVTRSSATTAQVRLGK
jgi:hypothetical protein